MNLMNSAPPQGFGPCGMPPNQAQYHQPQPQPPQAPQQQQSATIYSTQLSQASYGSNQVSPTVAKQNNDNRMDSMYQFNTKFTFASISFSFPAFQTEYGTI